jgi:hypothetical protein
LASALHKKLPARLAPSYRASVRQARVVDNSRVTPFRKDASWRHNRKAALRISATKLRFAGSELLA